MKAILLACASALLTGCYATSPPDPSRLEYKCGDLYRAKKPLFVEDTSNFIFIVKPHLALTEAREIDGQPERYLKNPNHDSYERIRAIVVPGSLLRVSRIETVQTGLGSSDWEVYARLLQPPLEGEEVSIYLVSGDYDRVGHGSNGCVDSRLLELVSRASKQEPEQASGGNGGQRR
jgi:hypothetical protein